MAESYSLGMALMDFIPNFAFLTGVYFLIQIARRERGGLCVSLLTAGSALVFLGGFLKAVWKLIVAMGGPDIQPLSEAQFVLLSIGFLGMLLAMTLFARSSLPAAPLAGGPALAMATWKIPFLAVMTLASIGAYGILTYLSFRRGQPLAGALFILAILTFFGMAGMASGEQTIARQWIEQSVNSGGQISFAIASYLLNRHSLAAFNVGGRP